MMYEQERSTHDIRKDERDAMIQARKNQRQSKIAELQGPTREQLLDLKRVQEERVASEKLRIIGIKPKEGLGVRYERKELKEDETLDNLTFKN